MSELLKTAVRKFTEIPDDDFSHFKTCFQQKYYKKNENFVIEGQLSREIGFINSGLFRMYYLQEGKEINTHFFFENDFAVSYPSFLLQQPSKYYVQAMEESEIISIHYDHLQAAYSSSHHWERFGRKVAECCFMECNSRTESFLFMTGEQRYLSLLENHPRIFDRIPLYHIASYLGIERESLSRLRRKILED
jgi:CRP/FNR family transcriptional regulator, anaerobic regulatory protein